MASRTIILLTLNEINGCVALLEKLPLKAAGEVLAVDGGSTDGTAEFLRSKGVTVYTQKQRGRGMAFQEGMANTKGEQVVFYSPDGNEDPADIPKLFGKLDEGFDMAICSRFLPDSVNEE